jgi:lipopolysaccharide/colanic/teichoic acid biosynthesis glycosyltransferase
LIKRFFDLISATVGLILISPVFLVVPLIIALDSRGPIFFKQWRTGKDRKPFQIYKFRTMVQNADKIGAQVTAGNDPRITTIGKFLRRYAIDELPTLINVLKGEMSIVGPRPELPKFLPYYTGKYQEILSVRPGLTDLGTLAFRDEAKYLSRLNHEEIYGREILPQKLELYLRYVHERSFLFDLKIVFKTLELILKQRKIG